MNQKNDEDLAELFGLEELNHVWLIKSGKYVYGKRNFSLQDAQTLLYEVQKSYPDRTFEIKQVK